jgi:hypothetical protein
VEQESGASASKFPPSPEATLEPTVRRTAATLFAAALALGAVAASHGEDAPDPSDHPCYDTATDTLSFPEQQVFFKQGESKVGNAAASPHPWGTEAPASSVQAGAGAGQVSLTGSQEQTRPAATVFEGTFTGCIDTLQFDLYSFDPTNRTSIGNAQAGNPGAPAAHFISLRVSVDGTEVFNGGTLETNTTHADDGVGPNLNQFSVSVGDAIEQFAAFFDDLEVAGEHTVRVEVAPWYANTGAAAVYAWDTTEVPSGITFNGAPDDAYLPVN